MSKRHKKIIRRPPKFDPRPIYYLFAEGKNTEPNYFTLFGHIVCGNRVAIAASRNTDSAPITVCDRAIEKKRQIEKDRRKGKASFSKGDNVWAIFDRDDHADFHQAIDKLEANGIKFCCSVPSFEIWILLHFIYSAKPFDRCDDVMFEIKKLMPNYSKSSTMDDLAEIVKSYDEAEKNARRLEKENNKHSEKYANPSTDVHKLTIVLRELAEKITNN